MKFSLSASMHLLLYNENEQLGVCSLLFFEPYVLCFGYLSICCFQSKAVLNFYGSEGAHLLYAMSPIPLNLLDQDYY